MTAKRVSPLCFLFLLCINSNVMIDVKLKVKKKLSAKLKCSELST